MAMGIRANGVNPPFFNNLLWWMPSRPSRGAWIETRLCGTCGTTGRRSRPSRGAWIETPDGDLQEKRETSRPSRGAWIETAASC